METNSKQPPNIILIITDQQRYDTIQALGYPHMSTPHLDRLASQAVSLDNCFITAPTCAPSRASLFTGAYPHTTGVYHNHCPWAPSWVEWLQRAGYHTVNVGKMHTVPFNVPGGFDQRFVVENKDRPLRLDDPHGGFYDEWDKYLYHRGLRKPSRDTYRREHPAWETALGAYEWPLEEDTHPDIFVGSMARWFIRERQAHSPLFLQIGFPGPHPPYDPPGRFLDAYQKVEVPVPETTAEELARQPPSQAELRREMIQGNHDAIRWTKAPSREQLLRLRRHYAANVTLIDEQIGKIMDALEGKGLLENAIVVFTSDHGDCLGDHGHIQKWTMYDEIVRVPTLVWAPGRLSPGLRVNGLVQLMDLAPTLFELAGIPWPSERAARSLLPLIEGKGDGHEVVFAEHSADNVLKGVEFVTMVRTRDWKLVHYLNQDWGELYDLHDDPHEIHNLWDDPGSQQVQRDLLGILRDWRIQDGL